MGLQLKITLSNKDRLSLENIVERGENWRERERAQTLLLLNEGLLMREVAEVLGISKKTVETTRKAWLETGFDSLPDLPRCGCPIKIGHEQRKKLWAAASAEPLSASALMAKHKENGGTPVHPNTLANTLKSMGLVWKRTRHSLKKREEIPFEAAKLDIEALRAQAQKGEIVLAYLDEAGFSQKHPNRSAWTPKGEQHLVDAQYSARLNVMAAMLSNGELVSAKYWEKTNSGVFLGFLSLLKEQI
jgi:transposase